MSFTQQQAQRPDGKRKKIREDDLSAYMPTTQEKKSPNAFSQEMPREFEKFQKIVLKQISGLSDMYQSLKKRFGHTTVEIEHEISKVTSLTDTVQGVFNDFAACYNSFV